MLILAFLWFLWKPGFESKFWSEFSVGRELRDTDSPWEDRRTVGRMNCLQYGKTGDLLAGTHTRAFTKSVTKAVEGIARLSAALRLPSHSLDGHS